MNLKFTYLVLGFSILTQLAISFYFSNEIINENQKFQENTLKIHELGQEIERLENLYTSHSALTHIYPTATASAYTPIDRTLNLKP